MAPEAFARRLGVALVAAAIGAGCRQPAPTVTVAPALDPATPVAQQDTVARFTLVDERQQRLRGARLQVEAHMSHPGMAPFVAELAERDDGVYETRLRFSMAGDWVLVVTGDLADGRRITERVDVTGVRSAP